MSYFMNLIHSNIAQRARKSPRQLGRSMTAGGCSGLHMRSGDSWCRAPDSEPPLWTGAGAGRGAAAGVMAAAQLPHWGPPTMWVTAK